LNKTLKIALIAMIDVVFLVVTQELLPQHLSLPQEAITVLDISTTVVLVAVIGYMIYRDKIKRN
jgi:hypothetical protein